MPSFAESVSQDQIEKGTYPHHFGLVVAKVAERLEDGTYELVYDSIATGERSAPARVVMPMAGAGRGLHFMPEPGDEVIVAFELGDPNLPIVLGSVWNDRQPPPDQARVSTENDVRTIVSRSGHQVTLDDAPGAEKVTVRSSAGHTVELDDAPGSKKVRIATAGGLSVQLDDVTKRVTIEGGQALSISAGQIQISAGGGIQLNANGLLMIDNMPFLAHVHVPFLLPPTGTTGPVKP
jgi:phage baseplate assembly protein gpV